MSRVRNATEFLLRFQRIQDDYEKLFAPRIAQIRLVYAGTPNERNLDSVLEHHIREYFVNAVLAALNWRADRNPKDDLPNIVSEAPVRSQKTGTIRRLDYLGLEKDTNEPLLIVETKRPSAKLPHPGGASSYPEIIARGLKGSDLGGEWNEWLTGLRDYVRSVHEKTQSVPRRVVITNGKWLLLFLQPSDSFLDTGTCDSDAVIVFADRSDIEERYWELFNHLEHGLVLEKARLLTLGELSFHLERSTLDRVMHGLRLRYIDQPGIYERRPVIKVAPVLFLRSIYGSWLGVENPPGEYEIPHEREELPEHLDHLDRAGRVLLNEVNRRLDAALQSSPLSRHYDDEDSFQALHGIVDRSNNEYMVVTGDRTHYLLRSPSVQSCPYHDWGACNAEHTASNPGPLVKRSIEPRAFFLSGEVHHCAHRDVSSAKAAQITTENRTRCGQRSGRDGDAFCEIWRFEQHLCCRICAFETVCTKATVFQLPCAR